MNYAGFYHAAVARETHGVGHVFPFGPHRRARLLRLGPRGRWVGYFFPLILLPVPGGTGLSQGFHSIRHDVDGPHQSGQPAGHRTNAPGDPSLQQGSSDRMAQSVCSRNDRRGGIGGKGDERGLSQPQGIGG